MKKITLSILLSIATICLSAQTMPEIISFALDTSNDKVSVDFWCVAKEKNTPIEVDFGTGTIYNYTLDDEVWTDIKMWISSAGIVKIYGAENSIRGLRVSGEKLYSIDVSKAKSLEDFDCSTNDLTTLDLTANTNLITVKCDWNQLESLNLPENSSLQGLDCMYNKLTVLDVSSCKNLIGLSCSWNKIGSLDLRSSTNLNGVQCMGNELTSLLLPKNQSMTGLACGYNKLTSLDLSGNLGLDEIYCDHNDLTVLDVSKHYAIRDLITSYNKIESLDVSKSLDVRAIICQDNMLTELKIAKNIKVGRIDCYNNYLTFITMPSPSQVELYNWYPQNAIQMFDSLPVDQSLDLSSLYTIDGVITTYEVYTDADVLLSEVEDYTMNGGKITFLNEYPNGVYCKMSNSAFPLPQPEEETLKKTKAEDVAFIQTSLIRIISSTTGICEESQYDMSVYTSGQSVCFNFEDVVNYTVYDLSGKQLFSGMLTAGKHSVNIGNKGIYVVKVIVDGKTMSKKVSLF